MRRVEPMLKLSSLRSLHGNASNQSIYERMIPISADWGGVRSSRSISLRTLTEISGGMDFSFNLVSNSPTSLEVSIPNSS